MICVADFYRLGNEHLSVNAALLLIISNHYKEEKIDFYAEEEHINNIKSYLANNKLTPGNIIFHTNTFRFKKTSGAIFVLKRSLHEIISLLNFQRSLSKATKPARLFFLSLSPIASVFYKFFLSKKESTLITLHGEVEFTRLNNNFTRNILGRFVKLSLRLKRKNIHYLALDPVVKASLLQYKLLQDNEIIAVPHPYLYKNECTATAYTFPFLIGHIGVASIEKQSQYLFSVAEELKEKIAQKKIEFQLIGRNETSLVSSLVVYSENKEMLPRPSFDERISRLHFTIFFYNDIYHFTSSGAVLDALNFEKPIIALKNDLFTAIFTRAGNIGFLCNDVNGMKEIIHKIANGEIDKAMYVQMQVNMRRYKENNSLQNIGQDLFTQLKVAEV